MTRTELAVTAATLVALGSMTVVAGPGITPALSVDQLLKIGVAAGQYQNDNRNYLPITFSPPQAPQTAWCTWTYGGKNTSAFWFSQFGGVFDAQARYRPLNAYMYPGRVWKPAQTPNSPGRLYDQAFAFRDPSDSVTYQRNWPQATTGRSTYDDVGTSYLTNMAWFQQLQSGPPIRSFTQAMTEGTRRIAATERLTPARFVWTADASLDVVAYQTNATYQLRNGYGDINRSCVLYLDGHAAYQPCPPGFTPATLNNANYDLIFSP